MSLDRQIVRLMAAMILAIIAYVAPSAVQAHEGHAHHGHHMAAAPVAHTAPPTAKAVPVSAKPEARSQAPIWTTVALPFAAVETARIEPTENGCCQAGCKTRCCGPMACCATGILSAPYALSPTLFRTGTLIPCDVAGRSGPGPEALPKPPRTLA
ncbi:hypothetical protein [Methylobacterium gregans]|uniref:CopL family metal-binding regulatory protein n=1 Tax=Methylobacterium gregans TaxID=374424 RepID=A0AA37HSB5_9HYPH|nr:hypothetical protein [Methylobacterium gregans]MDQ0523813.1 hypothetical protein [Methylobacterium gregans]GJD80750.1 hypothetical protein NBEOAGPD_3993 [Methylobacterium gregans]GLS57288.1 hypothetical protein GCM10007886_54740 [Methylobacterium gregans]